MCFVQIAQSFTGPGFLLLLRIMVASSVGIIVSVASEREKAGSTAQVNREVALSLIICGIVALFWSTFSGIKDKATMDKNRVAYLRFGKQAIAFGKVAGSSVQFLLQLVCSYALIIVIAVAGSFDVSGQDGGRVVAYFVGLLFYFALAQAGFRYIAARFDNAWHRMVALTVWGLATSGQYMIVGILNLSENQVVSFFADNRSWISVVPVLNSGLLHVLGGDLTTLLPDGAGHISLWEQTWPVLVMALECVVVCAVF